jgi:hypothetical protein
MRILVSILLLLSSSYSLSTGAAAPNSPFDQYGEIRWEDEKARLDNFAIQIQQITDGKYFGFILVYDSSGGCPGEAAARATRAKRYIVEHRGVPWERVAWRQDGYSQGISTTLLIVPKNVSLPYPFRNSDAPQTAGPLTRACKATLVRIRRSRW